MCTVRIWKDSTLSDTDDTSDDSNVGGMGKYSHGPIGLVHQHWVHQVISSGSFGVHCTEAAEAYHKICMHRASHRVRHGDTNQTQDHMTHYMCMDLLFQNLRSTHFPPPAPKTRKFKEVVGSVFKMWKPCDGAFAGTSFQQTFLDEEVRVTHGELMDLFCDTLGWPQSRLSYTRMERAHWSFGRRLVLPDGRMFWSTDSNYSAGHHAKRRRDTFYLEGSERIGGKQNALCCESMCFVRITGISGLHVVGHPTATDDSLTFVLGRWLQPHAYAVHRDQQYRPVCPGPLSMNHCLWTYARTSTTRRALLKRNGDCTNAFLMHRALFGKTLAQQQRCLDQEKNSYLCLVSPENIISRINIAPVFVDGSVNLDTSLLLHTVVCAE